MRSAEPVEALIHQQVADISPWDVREQTDQANVLAWIKSGEPLFRIMKPDLPPKHLVSYIVPVDLEAGSLLLMDHKTSGLWLPPGGHMEPGEHPLATVHREMQEELFVKPDFSTPFGEQPGFVTVTLTRGHSQHTDVSLWFVVALSSRHEINYDPREFGGYRWVALDEVDNLKVSEVDAEFHRFAAKLRNTLES